MKQINRGHWVTKRIGQTTVAERVDDQANHPHYPAAGLANRRLIVGKTV